MHDVIIAVIAAAVVAVGGGGTGLAITRRRRRAEGAATAPAPTAPAPSRPAAPPRPPTEPPGPVTEAPVTEAPVTEAPAGPVTEAPAGAVAEVPVDEHVGEPAGVPPGEPGGELGGGVAVEERPRLRDRLGRARSLFAGYLSGVRSRERIDQATWDDLEEALILADVGPEVTAGILGDLRSEVRSQGVTSPDGLVELLRADLVKRLCADRQLRFVDGATNVWLFVGVNGVGKTTTIGKVGMRERSQGRSVVLAAGDTFRAAAAEQLALWAERVGAEVVKGNEGGDPGAVIFDAVQHAAARGVDLVLGDTAGRLHTKVNLMEELKKVRRVAERPPGTVSEVLLVIDATTGQNGLIQARQFAEAAGVTGVVLTKLDGTAKGGIALAIQTELGIPIKLVGVGEGAADLIEFDPTEFVDALVSTEPAA